MESLEVLRVKAIYLAHKLQQKPIQPEEHFLKMPLARRYKYVSHKMPLEEVPRGSS